MLVCFLIAFIAIVPKFKNWILFCKRIQSFSFVLASSLLLICCAFYEMLNSFAWIIVFESKILSFVYSKITELKWAKTINNKTETRGRTIKRMSKKQFVKCFKNNKDNLFKQDASETNRIARAFKLLCSHFMLRG